MTAVGGDDTLSWREREQRLLAEAHRLNLASLDALDERFAVVGRAVRGTVPDADAALPSVVVIRDRRVIDVTHRYPSVADLLDQARPATAAKQADGEDLGPIEDFLGHGWDAEARSPGAALASPVDLQIIKACGVTFAVSMLERLIEEQAGGDRQREREFREEIERVIGSEINAIRPGSDAARRVERRLKGRGMWSPYLEVGIGPDVEVFTKAPVLSSVGHETELGLSPWSDWTTSEPELVVVCDPRGQVVGATLGNDVTLRDWEGRSALLLGRAKDYRRSCAIGPWIVTADNADADALIDMLLSGTVEVDISGRDGFHTAHSTKLAELSRPVTDIVAQASGPIHDYPDGLALFLGTVFAPTVPRGPEGRAFSHHEHDVVTVRHEMIGTLLNRFRSATRLPPWDSGVRAYATRRRATSGPH